MADRYRGAPGMPRPASDIVDSMLTKRHRRPTRPGPESHRAPGPAAGPLARPLGALGLALALGVSACSGSAAPTTPTAGSSTGSAASTSSAGAAGKAAGTTTAPTGTPTSTPTGSAGAGSAGRTVSIVVAGDILLHPGLTRQAAADAKAEPAGAAHGLNFRPLLKAAQPYVSGADLAFCNMETPLAPPGGPYSGYPVFSVPQEILPALKDTGFDACTTASNHAMDQGAKGIDRMLGAMDAIGLKHAGTARTAQEAGQLTTFDVKGVKVALLAYGYGLNGFQLPKDQPWAVNLIDIPKMLADAKAARAAGARIVAVAVHGGDEYVQSPNAQQRAVAKALAESGDVDLIYGHHVHVLQPVDRIGDVWVAYGMANMVSTQHLLAKLSMTQAEAMARFTFTEQPDGRFRATAAEVRPGAMSFMTETLRYVDLPTLLADPKLPAARRAAYQALYDRSVKALLALGADQKGLTVVRP